MHSGISYWAITGGLENTCPIEKAMAAAAAAGFEGIELAIAEHGVLTTSSSQAECATIRTSAQQHGLRLETIASGMSWVHCPTHPDPDVREHSLLLHEAALQRAAWLGAQALLYVPGAVTIPWAPDFVGPRYDQALDWAQAGVRRLARTAERVGVDLCVENVWNGLMYSPVEFAGFIDSIASPRVGVYFDVGNVLGYHQDPSHWIRILGPRIRRIHLKDFKRAVGTLAGFCDLLAGDVCFPDVVQALRDIGYGGSLVAEVMPPRPDLLDRTRQAMSAILAM